MKTPPAIVKDKPDLSGGFGTIPRAVLPAMNRKGMTDQARRLLLYYACQADGFHPSAKAVYDSTRLTEPHMNEARKKLEEAGFVKYDKQANQIRVTLSADHPHEK